MERTYYHTPQCSALVLTAETSVCTSTEKSFGSTINTITEEDRNDWI